MTLKSTDKHHSIIQDMTKKLVSNTRKKILKMLYLKLPCLDCSVQAVDVVSLGLVQICTVNINRKRRIGQVARTAFAKLSYVRKYSQYLTITMFNQYVLLAFIYESQVWTFTKTNIDRVIKTERVKRQLIDQYHD